MTLNGLKKWLQKEIDAAQQRVDAFKEDLNSKPPAYVFEWSNTELQYSAKLDVYSRLLAQIVEAEETGVRSSGDLLHFVHRKVLEDALRGAEDPKFSTSPLSNLVALYRTSALATLANNFEGFGFSWEEENEPKSVCGSIAW